MAETTEPPSDAGTSQADAMALAAEAEAAEAEALAAAARARARAARLKREALAMAPAEDENVPEEYADWEDAEDYDDYDDYEAADQEAARSASWRRRLRVRLPRLSTIAMAAAVVIICGSPGSADTLCGNTMRPPNASSAPRRSPPEPSKVSST